MNIETFYASGIVVDFALLFTSVELTSLWAYHRWTGRGLAPKVYLLNGIAGLCLMVCLRAALASCWVLMALGLIAAGIAHFLDLYLRASPGSRPTSVLRTLPTQCEKGRAESNKYAAEGAVQPL